MINKLKHFKWHDGEVGEVGEVGVLIKNDWLEIFQLSGKALPVELLPALLDAALTKKEVETIGQANEGREYPVAVQLVRGEYGSKTYFLKALVDEDKNIVSSIASLHISCYGKLNYGISMWIGDLAPILNEMDCKFNPYQFEEIPLLNLEWRKTFEFKELSAFLSQEKGRDKVKIGCATVNRVEGGLEIDGKIYSFNSQHEIYQVWSDYLITHKEEVQRKLKKICVKLEIVDDYNVIISHIGQDKVEVGCKTIHRVGGGIEIDSKFYCFGYHYNKEMGDELHEYINSHLGEVTYKLQSLGVHFEIDESLFRISRIS